MQGAEWQRSLHSHPRIDLAVDFWPQSRRLGRKFPEFLPVSEHVGTSRAVRSGRRSLPGS
jgi:hypothetical protein